MAYLLLPMKLQKNMGQKSHFGLMFLIRGAPPAILTSTLKMAPEEFHKVLSKSYAEVKTKEGDDNEPESLKMMQSFTGSDRTVEVVAQLSGSTQREGRGK